MFPLVLRFSNCSASYSFLFILEIYHGQHLHGLQNTKSLKTPALVENALHAEDAAAYKSFVHQKGPDQEHETTPTKVNGLPLSITHQYK